MENLYNVSQTLLKKLADMVDFDKLNSDLLPKTFNYDNKCFVITGSTSSQQLGYIDVIAVEVIPLENYEGTLKPLFERQHYHEVLNYKRPRGYNSRLLKDGNQLFVMIDPVVTFKPIEVPKQLELF